ncbi:MAG: hypothetical protein AAB774_02075 [Patescibacteria group bacterium]
MDTHDRKHSDKEGADITSVDAGKSVIDGFGFVIFFIVVVEILLLIGLNLYQKSRITTLSEKLAADQTALSLPENRTINTQVNEVLDGSDKLKNVLASKVKWSKFYVLLNAVTPKNVHLTSLAIAEGGTFRAEGDVGSLNDLAKLIVAWNQGTDAIPTPFSAISLNNNGYSSQGETRIVTFSVSGTVNTGVLQ